MDDEKFLGGWDDRTHFKVPTGQGPWEIFEAVKLVKAQFPIRIVELGCLYGGTLALWLQCLVDHPKATVLGIDPEIDKVREYVNDRRLMLFKGISANERAIHAAESLAPIDVLFIDGDHSYDGARYDFFTYGKMVKKGGEFPGPRTGPAGRAPVPDSTDTTSTIPVAISGTASIATDARRAIGGNISSRPNTAPERLPAHITAPPTESQLPNQQETPAAVPEPIAPAQQQ